MHTPNEEALRYIFVLVSPFGFVLFDLLYFAVVVAYASQSQLIQYYITSIIEKVRTKAYSLEDAIKVCVCVCMCVCMCALGVTFGSVLKS